MWENYFTANTLDEAIRLLADHEGEARIVAGGTDLILELERGLRAGVETLVDITRIPGLDEIRLDDRGWIHLGPMVTHNHCVGSKLIRERGAALARACWEVGSPQIRNRGTIAGNLVTASPANDSITPLMALGAHVTLRSRGGERVIPLHDFYTGVRGTVMRTDEVLTDISFPAVGGKTRSGFVKLALRRAQAISVVNVAAVVAVDGSQVTHAAITLGSVAPTIVHAEAAEAHLVGKPLRPEVMLETAGLAVKSARPIDDLRGSADYRREMIRVCTLRALKSVSGGKRQDGIPDEPVMLWGREEWHWRRPLGSTLLHRRGDAIRTTINGKAYAFERGQDKTLLRLLREEAGLTGTKEGCAEGECGACTVFLDGMAVMSCLVPAPRAHGAEIVTVEGLAQEGTLHPMQQAFIDEGAVQCGYCTPGFLMSGVKLLEERTHPSGDEIRQSMTGNLCRCTGYYKIISAFERAAQMAEE